MSHLRHARRCLFRLLLHPGLQANLGDDRGDGHHTGHCVEHRADRICEVQLYVARNTTAAAALAERPFPMSVVVTRERIWSTRTVPRIASPRLAAKFRTVCVMPVASP